MKLPDARHPLDAATAAAAFDQLFGRVDEAAAHRFLSAYADRAATRDELVAAAGALRSRARQIAAPDDAIDVCGTGGDGQHTLNVSTAVAFVVAACGVPVAKHGNRAASSRAGAADTLEALGLDLTRASEAAEDMLASLGIAFLFAPAFHPALAPLAPVRRAIGRRTIINLLGPLANPASVRRQLIGVAPAIDVAHYADVFLALGGERVMVVRSGEGADELGLEGDNLVHVAGAGLAPAALDARALGLDPAPVAALRGGDAKDNARALLGLLSSERGAYRDTVLLNAAAALLVAGVGGDAADALERARGAIDGGGARELLQRMVAF